MKKYFYDNTPALRELKEDVTKAAEKGFLFGLDKRKLNIRSSHAALNTLLQSAGAVIMKKALLIAVDELKKNNIKADLILSVHDEYQFQTTHENAVNVGKTVADAIVKSGEYFKLRCPLAAEFKIGNNWCETH